MSGSNECNYCSNVCGRSLTNMSGHYQDQGITVYVVRFSILEYTPPFTHTRKRKETKRYEVH